MSEHIPGALARAVRDRAGNICEYCHLPQLLQEAAFHIDHISPRSGKGPSHADNLALACVTCSLKKAARTRARDALSKELVPLFHPRHDRWRDHPLQVRRQRGLSDDYKNAYHARGSFAGSTKERAICKGCALPFLKDRLLPGESWHACQGND
jgi:hypothetical protein